MGVFKLNDNSVLNTKHIEGFEIVERNGGTKLLIRTGSGKVHTFPDSKNVNKKEISASVKFLTDQMNLE